MNAPVAAAPAQLDLRICGVTVRACAPAAPELLARLAARFSDGAAGLDEQLPDDRRVRIAVSGRTAVFEHGGLRGTLALDRGELVIPPSLVLGDALVRAAVALALARRGTLLLHAAALETAGGAVVATGRSGAGKSTLAAAFGALSDELCAIERRACGWQVVGTPWWRGSRGQKPLSQIVWLVRGEPPSARRIGGAELFRALMREACRYLPDPAMQSAQFSLCAELAARGGLRVAAREGGVVEDVRAALGSCLTRHDPK